MKKYQSKEEIIKRYNEIKEMVDMDLKSGKSADIKKLGVDNNDDMLLMSIYSLEIMLEAEGILYLSIVLSNLIGEKFLLSPDDLVVYLYKTLNAEKFIIDFSLAVEIDALADEAKEALEEANNASNRK